MLMLLIFGLRLDWKEKKGKGWDPTSKVTHDDQIYLT